MAKNGKHKPEYDPRKPAQTEREWWAMLKSDNKHFIRSMDDWKKALKSDDNPLNGCDKKTIDEFTKSLKFKHGGLGHADYSGVARQLNYLQFRNLWGRFGLGMELFEDHSEYRCEDKGTCTWSEMKICTSNC
jgi:hypothetical protein